MKFVRVLTSLSICGQQKEKMFEERNGVTVETASIRARRENESSEYHVAIEKRARRDVEVRTDSRKAEGTAVWLAKLSS